MLMIERQWVANPQHCVASPRAVPPETPAQVPDGDPPWCGTCGGTLLRGPSTSASSAARKDLALARLRISWSATSLVNRQSAAENCDSSAVRPAGYP